MKDYHNLYNQSDVLLLADIFDILAALAWYFVSTLIFHRAKSGLGYRIEKD